MTTDIPIDLIPPAFHILWEAANNDKRLMENDPLTLSDLHLSNSRTVKRRFSRCRNQRMRSFSDGSDTLIPFSDPTIIPKKNPEFELNRQQSFDLTAEIGHLYAKEAAAVCVLECERGEKLVKKSFHDIKDKFGRAKTEDYLLDWLSADLTSHHAVTVDVTIYLSCPPMSTTADGLRLWLSNLRDEGKCASMKLKLASLGFLHPSYEQKENSNRNIEPEEKEETLKGLRRLQETDVEISPVTPREWTELLTLLADKMALRHLEDSHKLSANHLRAILNCEAETNNNG